LRTPREKKKSDTFFEKRYRGTLPPPKKPEGGTAAATYATDEGFIHEGKRERKMGAGTSVDTVLEKNEINSGEYPLRE